MNCGVESVVLQLKRADTPASRTARKALNFCLTAAIPVPRILKPLGRLFYEFRFYVPVLWKRIRSLIYTTPIFFCRCESVGKRLQVIALPHVQGHTSLYIGNDVRFSGNLSIVSGRFNDRPTLRIGDRTFIGHNVSITCNEEVVIEDDVLIAGNCKISDYDGHPASPENRLARGLPGAGEIRPVRICKGAWIGFGAFIFKGVTVGEGAIVGANSAVTHDVPAYSLAVGSPARIVKRVGPDESSSVKKAVRAAA